MSLCIVDFATCFNLCYTLIHILGDIILRICPFLESAIAWEVVSFHSPIVERDLNTTKHHLSCRLLSTSTDIIQPLSPSSQSLSPARSLPNSQPGRTEKAAPVGTRVHPAFSLMDNVGKLSWTPKKQNWQRRRRPGCDTTRFFKGHLCEWQNVSKCIKMSYCNVLNVAHSCLQPSVTRMGGICRLRNRNPQRSSEHRPFNHNKPLFSSSLSESF